MVINLGVANSPSHSPFSLERKKLCTTPQCSKPKQEVALRRFLNGMDVFVMPMGSGSMRKRVLLARLMQKFHGPITT